MEMKAVMRPAILALIEQITDPAQVARPLFAHIANEQNIGLGLDLAGVQGAQIGQEGGEGSGCCRQPRAP